MSALLVLVCGLLVPFLQGIPLPGIIDGCKDCPPAVPELYKKFVGENRPPGLSAGYLIFHTLIYAPIGHLEGREVYDGPDNNTKYVRGFDDEVTSEEAAKRCSKQKGGLPDVASVDPAFLSWVVAGAFKVPAKVWVQNGTVESSEKCLALNALNSIVEDVECSAKLRVLCEVQNDEPVTDNTTSTGSSIATTTPSTTTASTTDVPSTSTPTTTTTSTTTSTTTTTTTATATPKMGCDATYGDYCYKLLYMKGYDSVNDANYGATWEQFDEECQKYGARLASVHSSEERNFIHGIYDKEKCEQHLPNAKGVNAAFLGSRYRSNFRRYIDENSMLNLDGTRYDYGLTQIILKEDNPEERNVTYGVPWCYGSSTTGNEPSRLAIRSLQTPKDTAYVCWTLVGFYEFQRCGVCKKSNAGNK